MREIKFTTKYEPTLSFKDEEFKKKYEERVGNNEDYCQMIDGEKKHLAVCPRCNNPVVILGIYKKIANTPHARHAKNIVIPNVTAYDEKKYLECPYHRKYANYVKEYISKDEQPYRQELYQIARDNFDKATYLLEKTTGMLITKKMACKLAENYAAVKAYNYIDATIYNIPWYLIYSFDGFPLYHMIVKKSTTLYRHLDNLDINMKESKIKQHVYVEDDRGYVLTATNYRYVVDDNEDLNEWLDFSVLKPDETESKTRLFNSIDRFSISVDSYHFGKLITYSKWKTRQTMLDIASKYMNS